MKGERLLFIGGQEDGKYHHVLSETYKVLENPPPPPHYGKDGDSEMQVIPTIKVFTYVRKGKAMVLQGLNVARELTGEEEEKARFNRLVTLLDGTIELTKMLHENIERMERWLDEHDKREMDE